MAGPNTEGTFDLPENTPLPGTEELGPISYVFVADDAFPFRGDILRCYPGQKHGVTRVFNFRLSNARRMVECSFSIMAAQCRLYHRMLGVFPEVAQKIAKATCMPHIFMRWKDSHSVPVPAVPGTSDRLEATMQPDRPLTGAEAEWKHLSTSHHSSSSQPHTLQVPPTVINIQWIQVILQQQLQ